MIISIIIPCFNEEDTIHLYYSAMESVRTQMQEDFEYIFINDGSSDNTLEVLRDLSTATENVSYLSFSRNFGKEAALFAGLKESTGEYVTVMDCDLQDPPEMLIQMKQMLDENADLDCVGTRRVTREGEPPNSFFFCTNVL